MLNRTPRHVTFVDSSGRIVNPRVVCCVCDGMGYDRADNECGFCGGYGFNEAEHHGPACDCNVCAFDLWVVADDGTVPTRGEHFVSRTDAIVRCVELAVLNGKPYAVREAPMYDAPENGERAYNWNDRDGVTFEHQGDATTDCPGTRHDAE